MRLKAINIGDAIATASIVAVVAHGEWPLALCLLAGYVATRISPHWLRRHARGAKEKMA